MKCRYLTLAALGCILGLAVSISPSTASATQEAASTDRPDSHPVPISETGFQEAPTPAILYGRPETRLTQGPVATAARQPQGALTGRIIYTSAGHGWSASTSGVWYTQRGDNNELVEDLGNGDQLAFFTTYCFNAGATVIPFRPIGNQENEVVLDNDDPGVTFTGAWSDSTSTIYYGDPGDPVPYRYAATTAGGGDPATARYTPTIPQTGFYPVYTWVRDGADRVSDQLYRIQHSGGLTEVRINHRWTGKFWIYLGTYHFEVGTNGYVEISNDSSDTTPATPRVFADAIRFGNGMGDINRGAGVSGKPRKDEGSRYWIQAGFGQGGDPEIYDRPTLNDADDNVRDPVRMAAWMNNASEGTMTDRLYLGFHSNAYDPGSLGLYNGNNYISSRTPNQIRWATLVAAECNHDLVAIGSPPLEYPWPDRIALGLSLILDRTDIEFGEINNVEINDEFDATIIEVAAHGNQNEARDMLDPKVRNWLARASYQACVRYFNEFGGGSVNFLPEPPTHVRAVTNATGQVVVSWNQPPVDGIGGDAATGYVVYRSHNGYGFADPVVVADGSITTVMIGGLAPGEVIYFRVAATNAGGESLPSETIAARPRVGSPADVLVVNGFDRIDRFMNVRETGTRIGSAGGPTETYDRVKPRLSNSYDYVVAHARALSAAGQSFDSCANETIIDGLLELGDYRAVVWILGEESTADSTFTPAEQNAVIEFLSGGGRLFASGAEIAWDLDGPSGPTTADRDFFNSWLKADYFGDDGGSYQATGSAGSILEGLIINFPPNPAAEIYDADYPDQLFPFGTATAAAAYSAGGAGIAAVQFAGGSPDHRVVLFGFPFETIGSESVRNDVMSRIFAFFEPPLQVGGWMLY